MRNLVMLSLLSTCTAPAGEWSSQEIAPKARSSPSTAYTIGKGVTQVGLVRQNVGLLDNLQIGTTAPLFALGVPNAQAKVTAIQTPKLDVSLDGGAYWTSLARFGVPDGDILVTPVGWTASWVISRRWSLHGGTAWTIARAQGSVSAAQIGQGLAAVTGADITEDLLPVVGAGAYAGANLTLYQTRLALDYRLNRRDSLVLSSNTWVWANGLLAAGVEAQDLGGVDVQGGASARVKIPLQESIPSLTTLCWQFDWRRANLRVGVPLPFENYFAWFQAFDFHVLLGKGRAAPTPAPEPEPVEVDPTDTGTRPADPSDTGLGQE